MTPWSRRNSTATQRTTRQPSVERGRRSKYRSARFAMIRTSRVTGDSSSSGSARTRRGGRDPPARRDTRPLKRLVPCLEPGESVRRHPRPTGTGCARHELGTRPVPIPTARSDGPYVRQYPCVSAAHRSRSASILRAIGRQRRARAVRNPTASSSSDRARQSRAMNSSSPLSGSLSSSPQRKGPEFPREGEAPSETLPGAGSHGGSPSRIPIPISVERYFVPGGRPGNVAAGGGGPLGRVRHRPVPDRGGGVPEPVGRRPRRYSAGLRHLGGRAHRNGRDLRRRGTGGLAGRSPQGTRRSSPCRISRHSVHRIEIRPADGDNRSTGLLATGGPSRVNVAPSCERLARAGPFAARRGRHGGARRRSPNIGVRLPRIGGRLHLRGGGPGR